MLTFAIPSRKVDTANPPASSKGKKRARLVCFRCHEKKIKCDLSREFPEGQPASRCSNCVDGDYSCEIRPSKRGRRRSKRTSAARSEGTTDSFTALAAIDEENSDNSQAEPHEDGGDEEDDAVGLQSPQLPQLQSQRPFETQLPPIPTPILPLEVVPELLNHQRPVSTVARRDRHPSFLGDSGYMQIFRHESGDLHSLQPSHPLDVDYTISGLQDGHLDIYFEYASTWCPILDRETVNAEPSLRQSQILRDALALCANQICPSLLNYSSSAEHYARAKALFYANHEPNLLIRIMAIMLFYWWSAEAPNVVSLDNTSWWTGTAIRVAQQLGLHCEAQSSSSTCKLVGEWDGLRRRIWWTLVARERITAISQGRPCLVDLRDCDTPMPTIKDFPPPHDIKVSLFISWVPLCALIGRIGDMLRRKPNDASSTALQLAQELIAWIKDLPSSLQPAFQNSRTKNFHRDIHGLHLTYLSTITLLHLNKEAQPLPEASIAAIVAASCTARIFHDYLIRGSISFLAGQSGWYLAIAILALLHARRLEGLRAHAEADIHILRTALNVMAKTWHSAKMFETGIESLMTSESQRGGRSEPTAIPPQPFTPSLDHASPIEGLDWRAYFPYVTSETSPLIGSIFDQDAAAWAFADLGWTFDFPAHLNQILTGSESMNLDYLSL